MDDPRKPVEISKPRVIAHALRWASIGWTGLCAIALVGGLFLGVSLAFSVGTPDELPVALLFLLAFYLALWGVPIAIARKLRRQLQANTLDTIPSTPTRKEAIIGAVLGVGICLALVGIWLLCIRALGRVL
jgi:hypothetical protein